MALRPQDQVTERELSDIVVDKLNYLGDYKLSDFEANVKIRKGKKVFHKAILG